MVGAGKWTLPDLGSTAGPAQLKVKWNAKMQPTEDTPSQNAQRRRESPAITSMGYGNPPQKNKKASVGFLPNLQQKPPPAYHRENMGTLVIQPGCLFQMKLSEMQTDEGLASIAHVSSLAKALQRQDSTSMKD